MSDEVKNKCENGFIILDVTVGAHVELCRTLINDPEQLWGRPTPIDEWAKGACCLEHRGRAEGSSGTHVMISSPANYAKYRDRQALFLGALALKGKAPIT